VFALINRNALCLRKNKVGSLFNQGIVARLFTARSTYGIAYVITNCGRLAAAALPLKVTFVNVGLLLEMLAIPPPPPLPGAELPLKVTFVNIGLLLE